MLLLDYWPLRRETRGAPRAWKNCRCWRCRSRCASRRTRSRSTTIRSARPRRTRSPCDLPTPSSATSATSNSRSGPSSCRSSTRTAPGRRRRSRVRPSCCIAITAVALWQRTRRPHVLIGWLWFLGMMVPVIGDHPVRLAGDGGPLHVPAAGRRVHYDCLVGAVAEAGRRRSRRRRARGVLWDVAVPAPVLAERPRALRPRDGRHREQPPRPWLRRQSPGRGEARRGSDGPVRAALELKPELLRKSTTTAATCFSAAGGRPRRSRPTAAPSRSIPIYPDAWNNLGIALACRASCRGGTEFRQGRGAGPAAGGHRGQPRARRRFRHRNHPADDDAAADDARTTSATPRGRTPSSPPRIRRRP